MAGPLPVILASSRQPSPSYILAVLSSLTVPLQVRMQLPPAFQVAVNVTVVAAADLAAAGIEPLPDGVNLVRNVYAIEGEGTASANHYTVDDEDDWLLHPTIVVVRMETAVTQIPQGVAFTMPISLSYADHTDDPVIV